MDIENLKTVVGFGLSFGEAVFNASLETSKLGKVKAFLSLFEEAPALFGVDYSKLRDEVKDLSAEERAELNSFIDAQFSISDSDKEYEIEAAIEVVLDLVAVVEKSVVVYQSIFKG